MRQLLLSDRQYQIVLDSIRGKHAMSSEIGSGDVDELQELLVTIGKHEIIPDQEQAA